MNWRDYFKLEVFQETATGKRLFFTQTLRTPADFGVHDLIINRFAYLRLTSEEKKRFSTDVRKLILSLEIFTSLEFKMVLQQFQHRLQMEKHPQLKLSTSGGGIYLFHDLSLADKKISCQTQDLPLSCHPLRFMSSPAVNLIYQPAAQSFLKDFHSLQLKLDHIAPVEMRDYKYKIA
jgi:hypothetical protein